MTGSTLMDLDRYSAVRLALRSQLLSAEGTGFPSGSEGVARIIEKLGYVQIDTISVVNRAHHVTLRTRCPDYSPEMLDRLLADDRRIFEYWGHAASYLPMSDYRFYTRRMRQFVDPMDKWAKDRFEKCGHLMDGVLERIRNEGPLGAVDFKSNPDDRTGEWWDWKPAKIALELLFWRGDLMITARRNFHRLYDLTERVLPGHVDTTEPDDGALGRFMVRRALSAHGIATGKQIALHLRPGGRDLVNRVIGELTDSRELVPATVDGEEGWFVFNGDLESLQGRVPSKMVRFLSPFDNLIIDRDRIKRLFGFDYALECYVPAAKRKHGYFVHPILWDGSLIGRMDPKADRKTRRLLVRSMSFEDGFMEFDRLLPHLSCALRDFAEFNGCDTVVLEKIVPRKLKRPLEKLL